MRRKIKKQKNYPRCADCQWESTCTQKHKGACQSFLNKLDIVIEDKPTNNDLVCVSETPSKPTISQKETPRPYNVPRVSNFTIATTILTVIIIYTIIFLVYLLGGYYK